MPPLVFKLLTGRNRAELRFLNVEQVDGGGSGATLWLWDLRGADFHTRSVLLRLYLSGSCLASESNPTEQHLC